MKKITKKKIIIISIVIIIAVIVGIVLKLTVFKEKFEKEKETDFFYNIINIYEEKPSDEEIKNKKERYEELKNSEEAVIENIEVEDNFTPIWLVTEESEKEYILGHKGEKSVKLIIAGISQMVGTEIKVNQVYKSNRSVKINFYSSGAPINVDKVITTNHLKIKEMLSQKQKVYTILDSIAKTIKANYGEKIKVYYSVNSENIKIEEIELEIDKDKPYEYLIKK